MFDSFLHNPNSWLNGEGPDSTIVISSRLRLARNLQNTLFSNRAKGLQKNEILKQMKKACSGVRQLKTARFVKMEDITPVDRQFLLERHLISQEHTLSPKGKGLVVSDDEKMSMMINEEDHIRLQVLASGLDLEHIWEKINRIDDELSKKVTYAFMPDLGYLTACPTNLGTALRASCMLHLPALVFTKKINKILELLTKLSFTARGLFGEGTQALGNFFQISNQVTLGLSEPELIENLAGIVNQIKDQERVARGNLLKKQKHVIEDSVWRAMGILKHARLMASKEALSHLSMLYLGVDLGIIKKIKRESISNLFINIQPAHLQKIEQRMLREQERDYIRAQLIRKNLGGKYV